MAKNNVAVRGLNPAVVCCCSVLRVSISVVWLGGSIWCTCLVVVSEVGLFLVVDVIKVLVVRGFIS